MHSKHPPTTRRPTRIAVISILLVVRGLLSIAGGINIIRLTALGQFPDTRVLVLAWAALMTGGLYAILSIGLFRLRRWARTGTIVVLWIGVIPSASRLFFGDPYSATWNLLLSFGILLYLRPRQSLFYGPPRTQASPPS